MCIVANCESNLLLAMKQKGMSTRLADEMVTASGPHRVISVPDIRSSFN